MTADLVEVLQGRATETAIATDPGNGVAAGTMTEEEIYALDHRDGKTVEPGPETGETGADPGPDLEESGRARARELGGMIGVNEVAHAVGTSDQLAAAPEGVTEAVPAPDPKSRRDHAPGLDPALGIVVETEMMRPELMRRRRPGGTEADPAPEDSAAALESLPAWCLIAMNRETDPVATGAGTAPATEIGVKIATERGIGTDEAAHVLSVTHPLLAYR